MGDESQKLIQLCEMFIQHEYDLEGFQSRLETAFFSIEMDIEKKDVLDELEEIRFSKLEIKSLSIWFRSRNENYFETQKVI